MKPKYQYFKTRQLAEKAAAKFDGGVFQNRFQLPGDSTKVKIVEFDLGFAIQFGDCGSYLERIKRANHAHA